MGGGRQSEQHSSLSCRESPGWTMEVWEGHSSHACSFPRPSVMDASYSAAWVAMMLLPDAPLMNRNGPLAPPTPFPTPHQVDHLWGPPVVAWPAGSMANFSSPIVAWLSLASSCPCPSPLGPHRYHCDPFISWGPGAQARCCVWKSPGPFG